MSYLLFEISMVLGAILALVFSEGRPFKLDYFIVFTLMIYALSSVLSSFAW